MQKFLNLKQVEDIKDVCLLRKMFDVIEIQIRSLENLGYKASSHGSSSLYGLSLKALDDFKNKQKSA